MRYTVEWASEQYSKNPDVGYLFFWGHRASKTGDLTQSCFSQWWMADFTVDGVTYNCTEQWMMAGKAKLFGDEEALRKILAATDPEKIKHLGRTIRAFEPTVWDVHKYEIVRQGNEYKFAQNPALKKFLGSTTEKIIVEASPYDTVWGIGLGSDTPGIENPATWQGLNLLGFALMEVRDTLHTS